MEHVVSNTSSLFSFHVVQFAIIVPSKDLFTASSVLCSSLSIFATASVCLPVDFAVDAPSLSLPFLKFSGIVHALLVVFAVAIDAEALRAAVVVQFTAVGLAVLVLNVADAAVPAVPPFADVLHASVGVVVGEVANAVSVGLAVLPHADMRCYV